MIYVKDVPGSIRLVMKSTMARYGNITKPRAGAIRGVYFFIGPC